MGFIIGLIQAAITVGVLALILLGIAFLFMVIFSLGTMFDKRISD